MNEKIVIFTPTQARNFSFVFWPKTWEMRLQLCEKLDKFIGRVHSGDYPPHITLPESVVIYSSGIRAEDFQETYASETKRKGNNSGGQFMRQDIAYHGPSKDYNRQGREL